MCTSYIKAEVLKDLIKQKEKDQKIKTIVESKMQEIESNNTDNDSEQMANIR